ncbi:MAG: prepilin-type N-terminal cleavage/methylation domain-containing protein, partial [Patescibacteria group bacterium]|nr:prepilin-type N-terminal cleavage/methylation domain-containing protein [Patescibacteria group bacterium]
MKFHKKSGFTLVELLVYTAIFAIASGLMIGIMTTMLRVNQRESASAEATSQLNFVMQTIQRLTRESSAIIVNSSSTNVDTDDTIASQQTRLVLRMKDSKDPNDTSPDPNERDPIIIYAENNVIKMSEGKGAYKRISDLTNSRVLADNLKFTKHTQYPGHDTVSIDIQLTYNSQNPDSKVSRALQTAIARVSAATFDSSILPGSTSYEIGQQGSPWSRTYLNDGTALNPSYTFGNDTSLGIFKVSGTSTIGFSTQGLERMRIDASGNVGIGTTAPFEKLVVSGNAYLGQGQNDSILRLGGSDYEWQLRKDWADSGKFKIKYLQGNLDALTIDRNGNVGIGTTAPGAKLSINGSTQVMLGNGLNLQNAGASANTVLSNPASGSTSELRVDTGITGALFVGNTGNVGIGTTTPGYKLQVGASGDGTSAIANAWNVFSDIRLKTNITPLTDILPKLDNISAVGFNWKNGADAKHQI